MAVAVAVALAVALAMVRADPRHRICLALQSGGLRSIWQAGLGGVSAAAAAAVGVAVAALALPVPNSFSPASFMNDIKPMMVSFESTLIERS